MRNVITVTSAGAGGASAITSFFINYDECFSCGFEVDLFRGSGGIYELYRMLDSNDLFLTHEILAKFVNLMERVESIVNVCENNAYPNYASQCINREATNQFRKLLNLFKKQIIDSDFYWPEHYYGIENIRKYNELIRISRRSTKNFFGKILSFLRKSIEKVIGTDKIEAKIDLSLPQKTYIKRSDLDSEHFIKIAKKFLNDFMEIISNRKTFVWLCLLTSNRVSTFEEQSAFFENLKMVFVTRDPRDTFTGWTKRNWLTDNQVDIFIKIYKYLHSDYPYNHDRILGIRFEDFVLNHEETSQKILDFVGISRNSKIANPLYNVEDSRKNIGRWKSYPNQKVMDKIAFELKDYLYET